VRKVLKMIEREVGCRIRGFGDMSVEEIADDSGLDVKFARLAKQRQYNETFKFEGTEEERETVLRRIEEEGFRYTRGGRYYQVMGGKGDKGKATRMLVELFREKFVEIETIGIGDSTSDIPMLAEVDMPILVQGPGGWWEKVGLPGVYHVEGVGPAGWSKATKELIVDSR
jgi:mannosyl-3-phosphoglycerate phosphatase family protein